MNSTSPKRATIPSSLTDDCEFKFEFRRVILHIIYMFYITTLFNFFLFNFYNIIDEEQKLPIIYTRLLRNFNFSCNFLSYCSIIYFTFISIQMKLMFYKKTHYGVDNNFSSISISSFVIVSFPMCTKSQSNVAIQGIERSCTAQISPL